MELRAQDASLIPHDNPVYELAMEEVSIAEALKLARDMLENPEKYGIKRRMNAEEGRKPPRC